MFKYLPFWWWLWHDHDENEDGVGDGAAAADGVDDNVDDEDNTEYVL